MFKILTTIAVLPLTIGFYNSFQDGADLSAIAHNISSVAGVNSGQAFDLGGGRTVSQALDSCTFRYNGCKKF